MGAQRLAEIFKQIEFIFGTGEFKGIASLIEIASECYSETLKELEKIIRPD